MTTRFDVPWKRIFIEGLAIVASILLAFSIDAWWDNRLDRQEERQVLAGLRTELQTNLGLIDQEIAYRKAVIRSILTMFDASLGKTELAPDEFDRLLGDVTWWTNVKYSRGVVDGLVLSGRLTVIRDKDLRTEIAGLPGRYDAINESERNDQTTTSNVIVPYLNAHAELTQIANTMANGRPGTGDTPTPAVYPVLEFRDHRTLLHEPEFLGILVEEHWNHLETLSSYEPFKASLERILQEIDARLASGGE